MFDEEQTGLIEEIAQMKIRSIVNGNKPNELLLGPLESAGLLLFLQNQEKGPQRPSALLNGVEGVLFMEMSVRCVDEAGVLACEAVAPLHLLNG